MKTEKLSDISPEAWDAACLRMGISSPWHTWHMLDYYAKSCSAENHSFLLYNDQGLLVAVCPLFVAEERGRGGDSTRSSSIGGAPLPSPLLCRQGDETRIRRNLRDLEEVLWGACAQLGILCARYVYRAYSYVDAQAPFFVTGGMGDLLALGCMPTFFQSVTIDLRRSIKTLEAELSKFHRKEIRKGESEGQRVLVVDPATDAAAIDMHFAAYQAAHCASAGRLTRPQSSFDAMRQMLHTGEATLFVNTFDGAPISYLYCGERNGVAFGWSQVNVLPVHVGSPRHFLEWTAIVHYASRGFVLYDVGPKYYPGQTGVIVTDKLASIGFFKERFGGVLSPEIHYRKFFDKEFCRNELTSELDAFLAASEVEMKESNV